ncbi:MAG TPA: hypothetical protein VME20_03890 [Acidimicrobiales bacterium]|nr:hypothetical protein [Acidimicrobiales bacterium]
MGSYIVLIMAVSKTMVDVNVHAWTSCYYGYEMVNGKKVKIPPSQREEFSFTHGWGISMSHVQLGASGAFHKSEIVPGQDGSSPTISGKIDGSQASGTFSAAGVHVGPNQCDSVNLTWKATFDPSAEPNPSEFG